MELPAMVIGVVIYESNIAPFFKNVSRREDGAVPRLIERPWNLFLHDWLRYSQQAF